MLAFTLAALGWGKAIQAQWFVAAVAPVPRRVQFVDVRKWASDSYQWLPDGRLLFVALRPNESAERARLYAGTVTALDVEHGTLSEVSAINRALVSSDRYVGLEAVSPDGSRVLVTQWTWATPLIEVYLESGEVRKASGVATITDLVPHLALVSWSRDSKQVAGVRFRYPGLVIRLANEDDLAISKDYRVVKSGAPIAARRGMVSLLGQLPGGQWAMATVQENAQNRLVFRSFVLPPAEVKAGAQVTLAEGWRITEARMSPSSGRIAFVASCFGVDPEGHNPPPGLRPTDKVTDLWTCSLDGSGLRRVARMTAWWADYDPQYASINSVRWLPDGKRISFLHRASMYIVQP